MSLRWVGCGLLLAASVSAIAHGQTQDGAQPYGTQDPNAPTPYGVRPPPKPYVPPATPLPVTPMDPGPARPRPITTIPYDPPGYGWCRYTDDADKRTFYSAPFPGSPKHDLTPRVGAFADYIHRTYPGYKGNVDCYWMPYDTAYASQTTEERNESGDQLRNYNMVNTHWKPAG